MITMDLTITDMANRAVSEWKSRMGGAAALVGAAAGLVAFGGATDAWAADWKAQPFVSVSGILSDNVDQLPRGEENGDFVIEVRPGISLRGTGGRVDLGLDYEAQGTFYTDNSDLSSFTNRLNFFSTTELVEERLFVDVGANYFQTANSPGVNASLDSLLADGTYSNVGSARISPRWRERFGSFAESDLTLLYALTRFENSTASDSDISSASWNIKSGDGATRLQWSLDLDREVTSYSGNTPSDSSNSAEANTSYAISDDWAVLARWGYTQDNISDLNNIIENGAYWSGGLRWSPSRKVSAAAWYGRKDQEYTLDLKPTERTTFHLGFSDRAVGEDSGPRWNMDFSHRTAYSSWGASYIDEVTNVQQLTANTNGLISFLDPATGQTMFFDPVTGRLLNRQETFTLRDGSFERKRFQLNSSYEKGRSLVYGSIYQEQRDFLSGDAAQEKSLGFNLSWSWRFAPRTRSVVSTEWERTSSSDGATDGDLLVGTIGVTHQLAADVDGLLEYKHSRSDVDSDLGYDENRLTMTINMRF